MSYQRLYRLQTFGDLCYYHLIGLSHNSDAQTISRRLSVIKWIIDCSNGNDNRVVVKQWTDFNAIEKVLTQQNNKRAYDELHRRNVCNTRNMHSDFLVKYHTLYFDII